LSNHDVALAPSRDGGYCLVALRRAVDLFTPIEMSTPRVLAETLALAERQGLKVRILPQCFDVDEPEDVEALARLVESDEVSLPRTRRVLPTLVAPHR
jgi:glycosyltransferase A (GT-A) superfamily protein (DUF2064 family)